MAGERLSEYAQRTRVLGTDPFTGQEMAVIVGFLFGEPTAALYLGDALADDDGPDPTCMLSIVQLGQIMALFNELESQSW
jgi:hypothetical protein